MLETQLIDTPHALATSEIFTLWGMAISADNYNDLVDFGDNILCKKQIVNHRMINFSKKCNRNLENE